MPSGKGVLGQSGKAEQILGSDIANEPQIWSLEDFNELQGIKKQPWKENRLMLIVEINSGCQAGDDSSEREAVWGLFKGELMLWVKRASKQEKMDSG